MVLNFVMNVMNDLKNPKNLLDCVQDAAHGKTFGTLNEFSGGLPISPPKIGIVRHP